MKKIYLLILLLCSMSNIFAQSGRVSGSIFETENKLSLPGAIIEIKALNKVTISDGNGDYSFNSLPNGTYKINVSYMGYQEVVKDVTVDNSDRLVNFSLNPLSIIGSDVIIFGDHLKGQAKALNQQKTNSNITNVVSSDQVGRFPDANIGDALKRIPGITMQNDQGEARDIVIRGIAPQLNSVTLNGERIPSAEGDNRRVQMDLIPSDMIQTIQVNKAVLPDMDADAIGGSVNLVTRSAPRNLRISGTLGSGVNLLSKKPIYTGAIVLGNRVLDNKLGFVLSASYNNHNFGSHNYEAVWVPHNNSAVIDEFDIRKYTVQRVRRSISANLDYKLAKNHTIMLSAMYNWRDDWENRWRMRVSKMEGAFEDGDFTDLGNGKFKVSKARVQYQTKGGIGNNRVKNTRLEDQRVYNLTLSGKHNFNKLNVNWNITGAKASEERPNERYMSFRQKNKAVDMDISDPYKPLVLLSDLGENKTIKLDEISEKYSFTYDQDLNAKLNFKYDYSNKGHLKFGARLRGKTKNRKNNFFEYKEIAGNIVDVASVPNKDYTDPSYLAGSKYKSGIFATPEYLGSLDLNNSSLFEQKDVPEEYAAGNYSAKENITAGYVMANHQLTDKLTAIGGVRYEHTNIDYTGNVFNIDTEEITQDSRSNKYGDLLPSLHLKYDINPSNIVRFAYTTTLARPNYYDLVPYAEFSPDDSELSRGNPNLKSSKAMNFDLMFESYFKNVGLLSFGLFNKNIKNFIYEQTVQNYTDPQFGSDLEYTTPKNGGTATVFGLEAAVQRNIWKGLGIYLNYTFTNSSTTGIQGRENEKLALPGTAKHMLNASLSYETKQLVSRISLNYANDYLDEIGGNSFEDRYYDRQLFLDINASYAITPSVRLFLEGNNLTNQPLRYYQGIRERSMQVEYYNARFNFGVKFDLNK